MLCELADREALLAKFECLLEVEVPSGSTERFALLSSALETCACSSYELLSLLLSDPPEDRDQQLTHGTLRIEPRFSKARDANAQTIEGEHHLHVARHRATETIERPNEQHIEGSSMRVVQELPQLWASPRCADLLLVDGFDDPATSCSESF